MGCAVGAGVGWGGWGTRCRGDASGVRSFATANDTPPCRAKCARRGWATRGVRASKLQASPLRQTMRPFGFGRDDSTFAGHWRLWVGLTALGFWGGRDLGLRPRLVWSAPLALGVGGWGGADFGGLNGEESGQG